MPEPTVVQVNIKIAGWGEGKSSAVGKFTDGSIDNVCEWYADELTFVDSDFIGKTDEQIGKMFLKRDTEYLRS